VTVKVLSSDALVVNRDYGVAVKQALANSTVQTVEGLVKFDKVFSPSELASLNSGATLAARLQYFNLAIEESYLNGSKVSSGQYAGGSYVFSFTVHKDPVTGVLKASDVAVD
jgi:hypothetical protein